MTPRCISSIVSPLKVVGERIRQLYGGDIGAFLKEDFGSRTASGDLRRLLGEQIDRGSALEQDVLRVLAVEREPASLTQLLAALGPHAGRGAVLDAVEALRRRSLVERAEADETAAFTLQPVVLEYVTDRLVEAVSDEIARGAPAQLIAQPLVKALGKEYVRQTQERLICAPILQLLDMQLGETGTQQRLVALLERWRARPLGEQGYGPGNVVNLLRLVHGGDLRGIDFSRLLVRQAYLAGVEAQNASLAECQLADAVLAEAFPPPLRVALSGDGALMAVGTSTEEVWLYRVADRTPVLALQGHTTAVWGVALSADARLLASGSADGTVRLWETDGGTCVAILQNEPCYERLDITGLTGATTAQREALLALGAIDRSVAVGASHGPESSFDSRSDRQ